MSKITGISRAQLTRLTHRWMEHRKIERRPARRPDFPRRYTAMDIAQLAEVDAAHEDLSGPAVNHLFQREFQEFGNNKFDRLAGISPSHIYNLRKSTDYSKIRVRVQHTQSAASVNRRTTPTGTKRQAWVLASRHGAPRSSRRQTRIVSYQCRGHGNAMASGGLRGDHLRESSDPVLEAMIHQFPFRILGFHSDNGSEYINENVVKLLNKILVGSSRNREPIEPRTTRWWRARTARCYASR